MAPQLRVIAISGLSTHIWFSMVLHGFSQFLKVLQSAAGVCISFTIIWKWFDPEHGVFSDKQPR